MKPSVVVAMFVMAICFAVVCESASVSKQRRAADAAGGDVTGWLAGLMTNRRHFIPPMKHFLAAQERTQTVRIRHFLVE